MPAPVIPASQHVDRARTLAREIGEPAMVYQIDHEDAWRTAVGPLAYADDPEFEAFNGSILAVVHPDGMVE